MVGLKPGASGIILPGNKSEQWRLTRGTPDVVSPLIYGKEVYLNRENGSIACLDAATGKQQYEERAHAQTYRASPVAADGKIYVTARDGTVSVLKAGPEFEVLSKNRIADSLTASPALASGRELARFGEAPEIKTNPAVVLGDAAYGSPKPPLKPDRPFHPLPHSKAETQAMAKALGDNTQMLTGTEASEAFLKKIIRPHVLHLSSHAFYFRSLPPLELPAGESPRLHTHNPLLRCGIALAGANTLIARPNQIADDGLFTGLEAAQLDLHGTELVILSACESSVGEIHAGEGAMSLRRAFRIAGAHTVLASQWPVSNAATQSLMKNFIAHWQSGAPRAQRELRQSEDHSSPYFWAAFTLTGQWR